MESNLLIKYGLTDRFKKEADQYDDKNFRLGRVIAQYQGLYKIVTDDGEYFAAISGKLRYHTDKLAKFPGVGDFVMVSCDASKDRAVIHHVLSRKSIFLRTAVGLKEQAQMIAANIDVVFLCMSLNNNYNLNRLERYLSTAWDSGATPVIVLTKTDLCQDLPKIVAEVEKIAPCSPILTLSMYDEDVTDKFRDYLPEGTTAAFIGSSGVGKSTLINKILGEQKLDTNEIGKADKGKHTTTGREMFPCPLGGVVIDTPGMRELGTETVDLSKSFQDIELLAENCRFRDCTHTKEPGCAVKQALQDGRIEERRLENYFKLMHESGYEGLDSRQIEEKKLERMFKEAGGMKNARKALKSNDKRRKHS